MSLNEVLILPYRNKLNHKEYLIKLEKIEKWDQHPDHCSISFEYDEKEDINKFIKEKMDNILNINSETENYYNLGISQASKDSDKTYYLYCINITKLNYVFDNSKYQFVDEEELIKNIDSQLLAAYSRLKFLRFK